MDHAFQALLSTRFSPALIPFFLIFSVIRFSYLRQPPLPKQAGILSQQN
jgi:hypothetical protein